MLQYLATKADYCIQKIYNKLAQEMGNQIAACRECTTINSTIQIINQQPKFNAIDYHFKESSMQASRHIPEQILSYNKNYQQFIAALRCNNIRFQDSYFPNSDGSLGSSLASQAKKYKWKRIFDLFPNRKIFDRCQMLQQNALDSTSSSFKPSKIKNFDEVNSTIYEALTQMSKYPQLIERAIPSPNIIREGMFIVYLCLNGQCRDPIEVVIDDSIPVDQSGKHLFARKDQSIWMLIIQKAFAKILGSYARLKNLQTSEYLQEIVGVPVHSLNWYNPDYHIQSSSHSLIGQKSTYYKFSLNSKSKVHLSIWQPRKALFNVDMPYVQMAAQIAMQTKNGYQRVAYASQLQANKLILSQNIYQQEICLPAGKYFLHVYGRFPKMINRRVNIVAYSQQKLTLRHRQENIMLQNKKLMIQKIFRDTLAKKKVSLVKQQKDLAVRFFWDGHRGIMCIKNQYEQIKQLRVQISSDKRMDVFFEDQPDQIQKIIQVTSGKYALLCFIRRSDHDIGHFYSIKAF